MRRGPISPFPLVAALIVCASSVAAQSAPAPIDSVSVEGVHRAGAVVDSVFVDRLMTRGSVAPGDFAAYLLARLGVEPFPAALPWRVRADSGLLVIRGQFRDIPAESRALFGSLLVLVDSTTTLEAEVRPAPAGAGLARFRLTRVLVGGTPLPEFLLLSVFNAVGRRYPALTDSGRDLYLQVPAEGRIRVLPGAIILDVAAGARGARQAERPMHR